MHRTNWVPMYAHCRTTNLKKYPCAAFNWVLHRLKDTKGTYSPFYCGILMTQAQHVWQSGLGIGSATQVTKHAFQFTTLVLFAIADSFEWPLCNDKNGHQTVDSVALQKHSRVWWLKVPLLTPSNVENPMTKNEPSRQPTIWKLF